MRNTWALLVPLILGILILSLSLLNNGVFWDDWTIHYVSSEGLLHTFQANGFPFTGHMHVLLRTWGPLGYRAVTLAFFLFSALFFYLTLSRLKVFGKKENLLLLTLFLVAPLNFAKWAAINGPSMIFSAFFFIGSYLAVLFLQSKNIFLRVLALTAFFTSYNVNSILVFYYSVLLLLFIVFGYVTKNKASWLKTLKQFPDFIFLPIVYWIIKAVFFKASGNYANYNVVSLSSLFRATLKSYQLLWFSWLQPILKSIEFGFLGGIIFALIAAIFLNKIWSYDKLRSKKIFWAGLFLLLTAGIPYMAVGKMPRYEAFHGRHQILMPMGFAFLTLGLLEFSFRKHMMTALFFLLGCFLCMQAVNQLEYLRDGAKQEAVIELFKHNNNVKAEHNFNIVDQTRHWNALERTVEFYELAGWFNGAYGDQSRFAIESSELRDLPEVKQERFYKEEYNLRYYVPSSRTCDLVIYASRSPTILEILFDKKQVQSLIGIELGACRD